MRAIVLFNLESRSVNHRIAGVIFTDYLYFDTCVRKALEEHLKEVYRATDIVYDARNHVVDFTTGGYAPYRSSFSVQVMQKDAVTEYTRGPIMTSTGKIVEDR